VAVALSLFFGRPVSDDYCVWESVEKAGPFQFLIESYMNTPFPFTNAMATVAGLIGGFSPARIPLIYASSSSLALLALVIGLHRLVPEPRTRGGKIWLSLAALLVFGTLTSSLFPVLGGWAYQGGWAAVPQHYLPSLGLIGFLHSIASNNRIERKSIRIFQIACLILALSGGYLVTSSTIIICGALLISALNKNPFQLATSTQYLLTAGILYGLSFFLFAYLSGALASRVTAIGEVSGNNIFSATGIASLAVNLGWLGVFSFVGLPAAMALVMGLGVGIQKIGANTDFNKRILVLTSFSFIATTSTIAALEAATYSAWWHGLPSQLLAVVVVFWAGTLLGSRISVNEVPHFARVLFLLLVLVVLLISATVLFLQFGEFIARSEVWDREWRDGGSAQLGTFPDQETAWIRRCVEDGIKYSRMSELTRKSF